MNKDIANLRVRNRAYRASEDGKLNMLRQALSSIVAQRLIDCGWKQKDLAHATGMHESRISDIVHCNDNCTTETICKVLHALGLEPILNARTANPATIPNYGQIEEEDTATSASSRLPEEESWSSYGARYLTSHIFASTECGSTAAPTSRPHKFRATG